MAIIFQIDGKREVRDFLGGAIARMRNTLPARKFVGEEMLLRTQRRLSGGVDVNGRPFKPSRRAEMFGGQTLFDRGTLAASANYDTPGTDLELFSSDKRARVHQEGLEIRPKKGTFLTIPLRARGGIFEGAISGVSVKANRTGARAGHYGDTFIKRFGDRAYIMQRVGGKKLRALFLLLRSVKMPKREWLGFSPDDMEMAADKIGGHITGEGKK
jgi:phage gpG-like protein